MTPKKILIFGGTHGNEWTGVFFVKKYAQIMKEEFKNLEIEFILANPEAFKINKRFKDEDLNRAFEFLGEERPFSYEHHRAKEIKKMIQNEKCFVIDLHTTTSNMGNTVIVSHREEMNLRVACGLSQSVPETRVILSSDPKRKYLASQSDFGLMVEIGPVANGVIQAKALEATIQIIREILTLLSSEAQVSGSFEVYEEVKDIYYPKNADGELLAFIHPDFQDRDFCELNGKYTPFQTFEGKSLTMMTDGINYPIFINEAAYYPAGLAYTLCEKKLLTL